MVVRKLLSYWEGHFLGAMLNFGGVWHVVCSQTSTRLMHQVYPIIWVDKVSVYQCGLDKGTYWVHEKVTP